MAHVSDTCTCPRCGFSQAEDDFDSHTMTISTFCPRCGYAQSQEYGEEPVVTESAGAYCWRAANGVSTLGLWKERPGDATLAGFDQALSEGKLAPGSYITVWDTERQEVLFLRGSAADLPAVDGEVFDEVRLVGYRVADVDGEADYHFELDQPEAAHTRFNEVTASGHHALLYRVFDWRYPEQHEGDEPPEPEVMWDSEGETPGTRAAGGGENPFRDLLAEDGA